jgi:hypothetical protein
MATREELETTFTPEDLDDLIHEMKSIESSNINNEGVSAQLDYLIELGLTPDQIEEAVKDGPISKEIADQE